MRVKAVKRFELLKPSIKNIISFYLVITTMVESLERALDFHNNYTLKVDTAVAFVKERLPVNFKPEFGITLGSGLGDLADAIKPIAKIPYKEIPNFPVPTVPGHDGLLIAGHLGATPVIGLKGRKHYYEVADELFGNGLLKVVFSVHVLAGLGVSNYFVTNAAGGLNPNYGVGDAMAIDSHINMIPNPLLGKQQPFNRLDGTPVWLFQPMNGAYDSTLTRMLADAALRTKSLNHFQRGVYLAVTGPSLETEGECIAFRDGLQADAVGMSTTPEAIVARNRGMRVVGLSCITNIIAKDGTNATTHEDVLATLESPKVRAQFTNLVKEFFLLYEDNKKLIDSINSR